MKPTITFTTDLNNIDWAAMKNVLVADDFDNGRTPDQLERSFINSAVAVIAWDQDQIIGTARALSDGVCNAYVVDVWTLTAYRNQGIARKMLEILMEKLPGQHVYLFTEEETVPFYQKLGFEQQGIGMSLVVGEWLENNPAE